MRSGCQAGHQSGGTSLVAEQGAWGGESSPLDERNEEQWDGDDRRWGSTCVEWSMSGSKLWRKRDCDRSVSILVIISRAAARLRSCDGWWLAMSWSVVLPPHWVSMQRKDEIDSLMVSATSHLMMRSLRSVSEGHYTERRRAVDKHAMSASLDSFSWTLTNSDLVSGWPDDLSVQWFFTPLSVLVPSGMHV